MSTWLIEPHDPLLFRDGRPFEATPGARARSLPFPFPSTTAGGVRTQAKTTEEGVFDIGTEDGEERKRLLADLKRLRVRGPFLVELTRQGQALAQPQWLVPAPLDLIIFKPQKQEKFPTLKRLEPLILPDNSETDFIYPQRAEGIPAHTFFFVGQANPTTAKPDGGAPTYWYWEQFVKWLHTPEELDGKEHQLSALGHKGPTREQRVHVGMDSDKRAGREGSLFDTSGFEFTRSNTAHAEQSAQNSSSYKERLALGVIVDESKYQLREGLDCLGGERRIVRWRRAEDSNLLNCPKDIKEAIVEQKYCRLILLTPGYFQDITLPRYLQPGNTTLKLQAQGLVTQRPQIVSGYDMATNRPKPTRRLAPAGSVFFLSLQDNTDEAEIRRWIDQVWLQSISDNDQERFDGFGLAVLGTWSGEPKPLKIEPEQPTTQEAR